MANITKRGNSYSIRVSAGYDASGKQIMKSMTWKIPEGMSEKKAEKEAQKVATLFEEKVRTGQIADEKSMKFSAYAEKWFSDYAATQLRPRTIDGYKHLMIRIEPALGHLYIDKIRPAHLVKFYSDLSSTPKECTYKCTVDLKALLKESGKSLTAFSSENNISLPALKSAANGRNLSPENAIQIAKALKKPLADLFEVSGGGETLSASTVGKYHRVLSSMFETAVKWGLIVSNPCERVSPPKDRKSKKNEAQFLTAEQAKEMISLLDHEPEKYRNATILLLFTGMRRGEMLGLEWDDLNLEKGTLRINKTIQYLPDRGIFEDDTKNQSSNRVIKLSRSAINVLKAQKRWQTEQRLKMGDCWEGSPKIFTNETGRIIHPDSFSGWFRSFIKANGFPEDIHVHSLRHTNATIQIANGSSVTTVAGYLGHANANTTTKIYAHAIQEAQAAAAEMLDDILNPTIKPQVRHA